MARITLKNSNIFKLIRPGNSRGAVSTLVRESIANPFMDFQKSTDINMDIHDFSMSVFKYPYKRGYPH